MARLKIDYGIDLGTTNSAICRMEKGVPVIIKSVSLKDTMPSCVSVARNGAMRYGDIAYNGLRSDKRRATKNWKKDDSNTYIEFKRTMGTDKSYFSKFLNRNFTSEELSAEILKTLKSYVTDEQFSSVVITVPAKFTVNQKTATLEAAKMAGFDKCELLQEPIAASMAYGLTADEKNGYWMVFDFGGGTFDAALLKVEDGIMQVFDTEGDNYLGGKNLDYAIVDDIIIPYLQENYVIDDILEDKDKKQILRDAMKTYAEDAKNQLSFNQQEEILSDLGELGEDDEGQEFELDLTITQDQLHEVIRPYFQKAVDICKTLLDRNNLTGNQLGKLILVGGPTHSPLVREMLKEQITPNVDTSIDPMTAVATGAALYASTRDAEIKNSDIEAGTVRLDVSYESTSVQPVELVTVILNRTDSGSNCPKSVMVELVSSDNTWLSGRTQIDEMGNVIEVNLKEGVANSFNINTYDQQGNKLNCFPSEITIIQGTVVGNAVLPYNIGIEIWNKSKKKLVFHPLNGLEKNKPLPAVGVVNDRKTSSVLRPGVESDVLTIPVYQAENYEGTTSASYLYEYVSDVRIDGTEVETLIPEGSTVEITLKVDQSEQMTMEVYFPAVDVTVTKDLDTSKKQSIDEADARIKKDILDAQRNIDKLRNEGIDVSDVQDDLDMVTNEDLNSEEKKAVLQHLKEVLRKVEAREDSTEYERLERQLKGFFDMLEEDQNKYGNEKTALIVKDLKQLADEAIRRKSVEMIKDVLEKARALDYKIALIEYFVVWVYGWNENFNVKSWKDRTRARQLINQAIAIINDQPTTEKLEPIVRQIGSLLPITELPEGSKGRLF